MESQAPLSNHAPLSAGIPPLSVSPKLSALQEKMQTCQQRLKEIGSLQEGRRIGAYADGSFTSVPRRAGLISSSINRLCVYSEIESLNRVASFLKNSIEDVQEFKAQAKSEGLTERQIDQSLNWWLESNTSLISLMNYCGNNKASIESQQLIEKDIIPLLTNLLTLLPLAIDDANLESENSAPPLPSPATTTPPQYTSNPIQNHLSTWSASITSSGIFGSRQSLLVNDEIWDDATTQICSLLRGERVDLQLKQCPVENRDAEEVSIPHMFKIDLERCTTLTSGKQIIATKQQNPQSLLAQPSSSVGQVYYDLMKELQLDESTLQHLSSYVNQAGIAEPYIRLCSMASDLDPRCNLILDSVKIMNWDLQRVTDDKRGEMIVWTDKHLFGCYDTPDNMLGFVGLKTIVEVPLSSLNSNKGNVQPGMLGKGVQVGVSVTQMRSTAEQAIKDLL